MTANDALNCPRCSPTADVLDVMDTAAFLDAVQENVVGPMRQTQALLGARAYVTRLYTTMSAEDMTLDPWFDFNPDLDDVSPVHTAERVVECNLGVTQAEAPWRAELDTGEVVYGEGTFSGWPVNPGDVPSNRRVLAIGVSGPGEVLVDNTADIQATLNAARPSVVAGGGCHALRREAGLFELAAYALIVFAFRGLLRRRRDG